MGTKVVDIICNFYSIEIIIHRNGGCIAVVVLAIAIHHSFDAIGCYINSSIVFYVLID